MLAVSSSFLSGIFDGIKNILQVLGNLGNLLSGLLGSLIAYIYCIFYYLFMSLAWIMNFGEALFKKFAGLDTLMTNDGKSADILTIFISSNEVWGLFVSIIVLSIILLFLFTFIAIIKSEFSLDVKGSAKGPIIARALKSLAMFIVVPTVSVMGIYAVNALTQTINGMFRGGDNIPMSNQIFYVAAYNANRARNDTNFANYITGSDFSDTDRNNDGGSWKDPNSVAYEIDVAFRAGRESKGSQWKYLSFGDRIERGLELDCLLGLQPAQWETSFNPWNAGCVNYYYSLTNFDYLLGIGTAVYMAFVLLSMCVVLIKRVFEITILLLLAPPMISMAPLDGGNASKSWQKEFIKRVIAIIGPVFAINMYFVLLPVFMSITLFSGGLNVGGVTAVGSTISNISAISIPLNQTSIGLASVYVMYDSFFQLLTMCVGMQVVKMASALISNLLGIEDLVKSGAEASKKAVGTAVQIAGMAVGAGAAVGGVVKSVAGGIKAKHSGGTFKEGWASTKSDRDKGLGLLKDKTLGSKMVKDSAFGELLDPDTYKNMGMTKKEIDKRDKKKAQKSDLEAKAAAEKEIADDRTKDSLRKRVEAQYDGTIGKNGSVSLRKQAANQEFLAAKKELKEAKNQVSSYIGENGQITDNAGYQAAIARQSAAQSRFDTAREENKSANAEYDRLSKEKASKLHAIDTGKVNMEDGIVTIKADKSSVDVAKEAWGSTTPISQLGELFDRMLKKVSGQNVPTESDKRINEELNTELAASQSVEQQNEAIKRNAEMINQEIEKQGVAEEAKGLMDAAKEGKTAEYVTSDAEAKVDEMELSEAVQRGINESLSALQNAIKEAMSAGKLNVKGVSEIKAKLDKQVQEAVKAKNEGKNDSDIAQILKDGLDAIRESLKKD